jgi:uncharacterized membrane protein YheB (UPF0754 family)
LLPILGGIIGFGFGAVALRMLFWPYRPLRFFKRRMPLTPGLVPREQRRIAEAIGRLVQDQFSREGIVAAALTAPETQQRIAAAADGLIQALKSEERPLRDCLADNIGSMRVAVAERKLKEAIAEKIIEGIVAMNAGGLLAAAIDKKLSEKSAQNGHGYGLGLKLLPFIGIAEATLVEKVNEVVAAKAPAVVREAVDSGADKLLDAPVKDLSANFDAQIQKIRALLIQRYNDGMRAILDTAFVKIDLGVIVRQEILKITPEQMDVKLSGFFRREFRTVRWFGALLGMIVGLLGALMAA